MPYSCFNRGGYCRLLILQTCSIHQAKTKSPETSETRVEKLRRNRFFYRILSIESVLHVGNVDYRRFCRYCQSQFVLNTKEVE